ncbi:hypothetical protein IT568_00605 [bacterium]|nr:hypothetical protein [bacterium]
MKQYFLTFFLCLFCFAKAFSQEKTSLSQNKREEIITGFSAYVLSLTNQNLIKNSETILLNNDTLEVNRDYTFNFQQGKIRFLLAPQSSDTIKVSYKVIPFNFKEPFFRRKKILLTTPDTTGNLIKIQTNESVFDFLEIEDAELKKSGSIFRSFEVGSDKDLTLNSGLRLQVSGKIAQNVDVVAILSDENTPIQPEGNTQNLDEVDKIFIDVRGTNFGATVGDYEISQTETEFANYSRVAKGGKIDGKFKNQEFYTAASTGKSLFTSYEFSGTEGNQGPYQLRGKNGETLITIPAGSERVYIDGERLTRGETNDYVINYNTGELTFTKNRLVTSNSRILVDFEYSSDNFNRTILVSNAKGTAFNKKLTVQTRFIREADDKNSPLTGDYTSEVKKALAEIGDNLKNSFVLSVSENVLGSYVKKTATVKIDNPNFTDSTFIYYEFSEQGNYSVDFYEVENGIGFYEQDSTNSGEKFYVFLFGKIGKWDIKRTTYAIPSGTNLADFSLKVKPLEKLSFSSEIALSDHDKNFYSNKNDSDNLGNAYNFSGELEKINLGKAGNFTLKGRLRLKEERFVEVDRVGEIEFNRKYNLSSGLGGKEELRETSLDYFPNEKLKITFGVGETKKGENFSSLRKETKLKTLTQKGFLIDLQGDQVSSKNLTQKTSWFREKGDFGYAFERIFYGFKVDFERQETKIDTSKNGLQFYEVGPEMNFSGIFGSEVSTYLTYRNDEKILDKEFTKESEALTFRNEWKFTKFKSWDLLSDVTYREKNFTKEFENEFLQDTKTFLTDVSVSQRGFNNGITSDFHYTVRDEQTRELVEEFIPDKNGIYVFDDSLFRPVNSSDFGDKILYRRELKPIGDFIPILNLSAGARIKTKFKSLFQGNEEWFFRNFGTETRIRISEETKEKDKLKIYLFDLEAFQRDATTIKGTLGLTQDFLFLEDTKNHNLKLTLGFEDSENNQLSQGKQERFSREISLRYRGKFLNRYGLNSNFLRELVEQTYKDGSGENTNLTKNTLFLGFSYFWGANLVFGNDFKVNLNSNKETETQTGKIFALTPNLQYSFKRKGRLTSDFTLTKVFVKSENLSVPYSLTSGLQEGNSFDWNLRFDYRISNNVSSSLSYSGKKHSGDKFVTHLGKAEIRAFF